MKATRGRAQAELDHLAVAGEMCSLGPGAPEGASIDERFGCELAASV